MAKPTLSLPSAAKPATVAPTVEVQIPAPYLGAPVVVRTSEKISGQSEHAAIVTQVHSDDLVSVMVFPGSGQPYPIASIKRASGLPSWQWPARN